MFKIIKQVFIILLSFRRSLAFMNNIPNSTTYISLNNQSCITKPTLMDLNHDEHSH